MRLYNRLTAVTGLTAKEVSPSTPVEFRPQETVENLVPYQRTPEAVEHETEKQHVTMLNQWRDVEIKEATLWIWEIKTTQLLKWSQVTIVWKEKL